MPTHDIRLTRILYMYISLRFRILTVHAVRVERLYPSEQPREQTSFIW